MGKYNFSNEWMKQSNSKKSNPIKLNYDWEPRELQQQNTDLRRQIKNGIQTKVRKSYDFILNVN